MCSACSGDYEMDETPEVEEIDPLPGQISRAARKLRILLDRSIDHAEALRLTAQIDREEKVA